MIRIPEHEIDAALQNRLAVHQRRVDSGRDYPHRVALAAAEFKAANVKGQPVFEEIKKHLDSMCSGAKRCMYCEDSAADEVEHFHPKTFYPEQAFVWMNYLYACGPCNGAKRSRFAVRLSSGEINYLLRKPKSVPVEPPSGTALPLNPRSDNPLEHIILDLAGGTLAFTPAADGDSKSWVRAAYTIELLKLNRDVLIRARIEAFKNYVSRLDTYMHERDRGADGRQLEASARSIRRMQHPTVWQEMCRQWEKIALLHQLFSSVPEALTW